MRPGYTRHLFTIALPRIGTKRRRYARWCGLTAWWEIWIGRPNDVGSDCISVMTEEALKVRLDQLELEIAEIKAHLVI